MTAAELVTRSRRAQGLPAKVDDVAVLATIAAMLRRGGDSP